MNALALPSLRQHPTRTLLRESSVRDNSQYGGLQVYVLCSFCYIISRRVIEGPHDISVCRVCFFQLICWFSLVSLAVLETLTR